MMSSRARELFSRLNRTAQSPSEWDLEAAEMVFGEVPIPLVAVGTVAGDSFMWSWANETFPEQAKTSITLVREFGEKHDLELLVTPCALGGLAQAKECLVLAGRVLDAKGVWLDRTGDEYIAFALGPL